MSKVSQIAKFPTVRQDTIRTQQGFVVSTSDSLKNQKLNLDDYITHIYKLQLAMI